MTDATIAQPSIGTNYLRIAQDAFSSSTNYFDSSIRKQVESALRQFQGVHPAGSKYHSDAYKTRSRLFRPKTRGMVRKNEAVACEALFSARDVVVVGADDENNQTQRAAAALMKQLVNYRLKKTIPWFLVSMGAYQDAQVVGACISFNYWQFDAKKKIDRPCIELLPVENCRFDPGASWMDPVNTSPYWIRMIPMYVKDVKARMRKLDPKTGAPKWKTVDDSQILAAVQSYSDSTRQTRERGRTDSKEQSTALSDFAIVWVHENIVEIDGSDVVYYTLSTVAQLSDPVSIEQVYWHGKRPFTMGYSVIETHKNYPDGPVGITRDVQAEINDLANLRQDNVKFALNKRYFAKRGAQVDIRSLTRNVPGSVTLMQSLDDVKVMDTGDVTGSAYEEQDRLNLDFDEVAGTFSSASVQSNRRLNETVGGMNLLTGNANQVGAYQLRTWVETWVEPTLRQLMLLEAHYETDVNILRLAGTRAKLQEQFGIEAITEELLQEDVSLHVDVGMGATNPQERVSNFLSGMRAVKELLMDGVLERYGLDVEDVIGEVFSHLGYRDGHQFFDRADDPNLSALQARVEELQQAVAAKHSPEMLAAQLQKIEAEIENTSAKTRDTLASALERTMRSIFAAHQTGQMIATLPDIAPVADTVLDEAAVMSGNQPTIGSGPVLDKPLAGLTQNSVSTPGTGIEYTPGAPGDTTPNTPASPMQGAEEGIETMRNEQ